MNHTQTKSHAPGGVLEMMAIALPMIVSYGCDTVIMFCDRWLLAKLGPDLMNAAVGGGVSAFLMVSFGFGLIGYGTALVAQYYGAGQKEKCSIVTTQAWIVGLVLYPIVLVVRPMMHGVFERMGVPASQLGPQIQYFDIMAYGSIFVFARHAMASFFSGIGRTRIVMGASLTAMIVNVIASYILIYGKWGAPVLGIRGAGIGSVIGSVAAVGVLAAAYWGPKTRVEFAVDRSLVWRADIMGKLLRFGSPSGMEMLLTLVAANGFVLAFHSLGPVVATASSILMNWDISAFIPMMGLEVGVTSLVGRYLGARQPDIAHRATMSGLKVGCVYAMVLFVLFGVFAQPMVEMFRPSGVNMIFIDAMPMAVTMLRMISLYMFSIVFVVVFVGALRGAGDTLWAMSYHVSLHWLAAGVLYGATRWLGLSALAAWAWVIALFMAFSGMAWMRYRTGKWKSIQLIES